MQIDHDKKNTVDFSRLEMIVSIYGDHLTIPFEKIKSSRTVLNEIITSHKRAYKSRDIDGEYYLQALTDAQVRLEVDVEAFKKKIASLAKGT